MPLLLKSINCLGFSSKITVSLLCLFLFLLLQPPATYIFNRSICWIKCGISSIEIWLWCSQAIIVTVTWMEIFSQLWITRLLCRKCDFYFIFFPQKYTVSDFTSNKNNLLKPVCFYTSTMASRCPAQMFVSQHSFRKNNYLSTNMSLLAYPPFSNLELSTERLIWHYNTPLFSAYLSSLTFCPFLINLISSYKKYNLLKCLCQVESGRKGVASENI